MNILHKKIDSTQISYPFITHMGADRVDHFEELVILADKTSGILGVRFQIQGNQFLVIDVGRNCFGKPVPLSNLVFTPIVDLAEALHLRLKTQESF